MNNTICCICLYTHMGYIIIIEDDSQLDKRGLGGTWKY